MGADCGARTGRGLGRGGGPGTRAPARLEVQITPGGWPPPHLYTFSGVSFLPLPPTTLLPPGWGGPHRPSDLGR